MSTQFHREIERINDPTTINKLVEEISNGASIIDVCKKWEVRYSVIQSWIHADDARNKQYLGALNDRNDWMIQRLLTEIQRLAFVDIRGLFNDDHSLKQPSEWPEDIAAAIGGLEVNELWDDEIVDGQKRKVQIGLVKKVKIVDKLKALEMLGRDLGRFVQKHEVTGKLTLEELVAGSYKPVAPTTDTKI